MRFPADPPLWHRDYHTGTILSKMVSHPSVFNVQVAKPGPLRGAKRLPNITPRLCRILVARNTRKRS